MRIRLILLACLCSFLCHWQLAASVYADDWPQFRGISGQGICNDKDLLIICADQNQKKSRIIAFERATGTIKYDVPRPMVAYAHSTPVLAKVAGKSQLLVAANGALQGMNPDNGQIIWWCKSDGDASSPAWKDDLAYIDSGRGSNGIAVDITGVGDVTKTN